LSLEAEYTPQEEAGGPEGRARTPPRRVIPARTVLRSSHGLRGARPWVVEVSPVVSLEAATTSMERTEPAAARAPRGAEAVVGRGA
jgi:hypothetical protein